MRIYLASWPPSVKSYTTFVGGDIQILGQKKAVEKMSKLIKDNQRLRILISYWYYKNVDIDKMLEDYFTPPYPDIFADSGAFSAMTKGVNITCTEYAVWVKKWKHCFTTYANLDVIGNAEATYENQIKLENMGIEPIPCFHVNEDFKYLERYIENYPYIALGVAGMQNNNGLIPWLIKCFKLAKGKVVYHGFALTSWKIMKMFPWYSVDSSSWGSGFRFGKVKIFDYYHGRFIGCDLGDRKQWYKHRKIVQSLGFNPLDFADRKRNKREAICAISALSYMLAEKWLRRYHGEMNIYLADGSSSNLKDADKGLKLYLAETSNTFNDIRSINKC